MRILHLTLKKKWFDMIASGEKKEEYREIKLYWIKRLLSNIEHLTTANDVAAVGARFNEFDYICFRNGYSFDCPEMIIECNGVSIGTGKEELGAPKEEVFIIKLGSITSLENYVAL